MVNKDKKVLINEGRQISNGKLAYGGFPRILSEEGGAVEAFRDDNLGDQATKPNEAKKKLPTETLTGLMMSNTYEGTDEGPETYKLFDPEIHKKLMNLVGYDVEAYHSKNEIPSERSIKPISTALDLLHQHGHGEHPASYILDKMRDEAIQAESQRQYMSDRRRGYHNPH